MQIIDVRIRRADYPEATSQNIFNRMRSEENKLKNSEQKVLKRLKKSVLMQKNRKLFLLQRAKKSRSFTRKW